MPLHTDTPIPHFTFDLLDAAGVQHAIFTRKGGLSPAPWHSLNMGGTVGDRPERVRANIRRALRAFGRDLNSVYDVWQVHGRDVVCADAPRNGAEHARADAVLSDAPGLTLMMRFADCVPVLLYDPVRRVGGLVHAGWQGTVKGVVPAAVQRMQRQYGSSPRDILAGIGPSIGPDHYEVGAEVVARVQDAFGAQAKTLIFTPNGRPHLDLWRANALWLRQAGVRQVEIAGMCTACDLEHWYSHRAERGATGRFGAMLVVP